MTTSHSKVHRTPWRWFSVWNPLFNRSGDSRSFSGSANGFPGTREIPVPPYVILYKVSDQAITILTVVHGRRKFPGPDHPQGVSQG